VETTSPAEKEVAATTLAIGSAFRNVYIEPEKQRSCGRVSVAEIP
jgi:hypothetical protein